MIKNVYTLLGAKCIQTYVSIDSRITYTYRYISTYIYYIPITYHNHEMTFDLLINR